MRIFLKSYTPYYKPLDCENKGPSKFQILRIYMHMYEIMYILKTYLGKEYLEILEGEARSRLIERYQMSLKYFCWTGQLSGFTGTKFLASLKNDNMSFFHPRYIQNTYKIVYMVYISWGVKENYYKSVIDVENVLMK
jgi:hypothetical protein